MRLSNFLLKPLLILSIAVPVMATVNVSDADARHKKYRGAAIAGAIIGGAIVYHHYKKRKKYRHYGHSRHRVARRHHHRGYYHRHSRYGHRHYHRY